jgi:PAS domain S-box-containing protein
MDTNRSLLFGALALQTGLIDARQFSEACKSWGLRPQQSLEDILTARGWILPTDKPHLEYLLERTLDKHASDAKAALSDLPCVIRQSLAALEVLNSDSTVAASAVVPGSEAASPTAGDRALETRYALTSLHATGGIGRVWLARDRHLDREVAIKELRPEKAGNIKVATRFVREARLTGYLEHPGVVPVYELGSRPDTHRPFYTMRFVRGRTLSGAADAYHAKRAKGHAEPLDFVALLNAFAAVCNTIAYAHSRGVLHRDLKGDNVILGDFGEVIVLDWGLAKQVGQPDQEDSQATGVPWEAGQDAGLTIQGEIMGTPAYMAPEQAEGRLDRIDQRTDIYGLGAILYEVLTGRPPFVGANTLAVLHMAARGNPIPPRQLWPDVPPALEEVCLKAMAKDPDKRYARAADLAQEVQRWQDVQRRQAEDALRRQSEILRSIVNSMSDGVLVADAAGNLVLINPAAERMIGRPPEATLAGIRSTVEFCRPDSLTPFTAEDLPSMRAIRGEEVNDMEMFLRPFAAGQGSWVSANARPLRNESGAIRGGVVVFRDITDRKRAEEELLRSRERFELAVRGSQDGLWDWDLRTNDVYYSPRWKSILGYEDHEIAHRLEEWEQRLHPEERERVLAANFAHIGGTTPHYEYEYRLRHKDGAYRWILARGVALRDAAGKAYRMAGSHVDITAHKEALQAMRDSEERYQAVLEALPVAVVVHDADGTVATHNKAARSLLGLDSESPAGKTHLNSGLGWVCEDGSPLPWHLHPACLSLRTGHPCLAMPVGLRRRDGTLTWVSVGSEPLFRQGDPRPYAVVTTYEEVADRGRRAEGSPVKVEK